MRTRQCVTGEKRRRLNRDIHSETESQLSLINREIDTVPHPTSNADGDELRKAWTMGMPTIDGDISMINTEYVGDPSKNTNEEDDKKPSPVEKTDQETNNDQLNAYEEYDRDEDSKKAKEFKKNTRRTQKIIHMEFESDDDVDGQAKNYSNVKAEGKV